MASRLHTLTVTEAEAGLRLDVYLTRHLGLSRRAAQRLLEGQQVRVEGRTASKGLALQAGWKVEVESFSEEGQEKVAEYQGPELEILGEGSGWVAVDKPAGMPVHPLSEGERDTALNFVASRFAGIMGVGEGGLRSGVVHRLDVDTSGILLFALEEKMWKQLRAAFSAHRTEKVYQAVVHGRLERPVKVEFDLRIARHKPAKVEVKPLGEGGKGCRTCATALKPLEVFRRATLVEARPVSGFLHQIRATLAHMGHPLLGDRLYGPPDDPVPVQRHLLHASLLRIDDILLESSLPEDFERVLERL